MNILKEIDENSPYFKCEHCSQEFSRQTFRIAVLLYGVIFLVGKQYGYVGIVCPNCISTTLSKVDTQQLGAIKNDLGDSISVAIYGKSKEKKHVDDKEEYIAIFLDKIDMGELRSFEDRYELKAKSFSLFRANLKYNTFAQESDDIAIRRNP